MDTKKTRSPTIANTMIMHNTHQCKYLNALMLSSLVTKVKWLIFPEWLISRIMYYCMEKMYMYANIFLNHIKKCRRPLLWTVIVSQLDPRNTTRMIHYIKNYDQSMINWIEDHITGKQIDITDNFVVNRQYFLFIQSSIQRWKGNFLGVADVMFDLSNFGFASCGRYSRQHALLEHCAQRQICLMDAKTDVSYNSYSQEHMDEI